MFQIELSTEAYFTQGNIFKGSATPEKHIGNPLADIFNFHVFCKKGDDGEKLVAEYYIGSRCYELTDPDTIISRKFEMSDGGIAEAQQWLTAEFEKLNESL